MRTTFSQESDSERIFAEVMSKSRVYCFEHCSSQQHVNSSIRDTALKSSVVLSDLSVV